MFFKLVNISRVIFHALKDTSVTFRPDPAHEITIRGLTEEELKDYKAQAMSDFLITIIWERDVTRRALPMFESLSQHRLPEGSEKAPEDNEFFNSDGTINFSIPMMGNRFLTDSDLTSCPNRFRYLRKS